MGLNGILNVNKLCGPTSFRIVDTIRRLSGEKRVGHAGTLDPGACGVLPVCLGQAVRLTEYIHRFDKEYIAGIMLGATTDTLDAQGSIMSRGDITGITAKGIEQALDAFTGEISQSPPLYSAVKIGGKKSYRLARSGVSVPLKPRFVRVNSIEMLSCEPPYLKIRVNCSTGTYIRAIARDLGEALGCGAHLKDLVRTAYGPYRMEDAFSLEEIEKSGRHFDFSPILLPVDHPLQSWQHKVLDDRMATCVLSGTPVSMKPPLPDTQQLLRCYDHKGRFLAILKFSPATGLWHPEKVFTM